MRWTEIEAYARDNDIPAPSYGQMDRWTRRGKLTSEIRKDRTGHFRWWPDAESHVALTVARLLSLGFGEGLAFLVARTEPDTAGHRTLVLDGAAEPVVTVSVGTR